MQTSMMLLKNIKLCAKILMSMTAKIFMVKFAWSFVSSFHFCHILFLAQKRQLRERVADVTTITTTAQSSFPADKRNKIFQTIRDGLNHPEFLTLSRYLKIDSNLIQNITIRHHDIGTRTMVMLELYESQGRSLEPLLSAIRMMGRTDVVRKVEKI